MKTGTILAALAGVGALAFFATRKASAKSGATVLWCAGDTQGNCQVQAASPEAAAQAWLVSPFGVPVMGATVGPTGSEVAGQWGVFSEGTTVRYFNVWPMV